jgi:hypothetical protein
MVQAIGPHLFLRLIDPRLNASVCSRLRLQRSRNDGHYFVLLIWTRH